jgi:hypothetical protein
MGRDSKLLPPSYMRVRISACLAAQDNFCKGGHAEQIYKKYFIICFIYLLARREYRPRPGAQAPPNRCSRASTKLTWGRQWRMTSRRDSRRPGTRVPRCSLRCPPTAAPCAPRPLQRCATPARAQQPSGGPGVCGADSPASELRGVGYGAAGGGLRRAPGAGRRAAREAPRRHERLPPQTPRVGAVNRARGETRRASHRAARARAGMMHRPHSRTHAPRRGAGPGPPP